MTVHQKCTDRVKVPRRGSAKPKRPCKVNEGEISESCEGIAKKQKLSLHEPVALLFPDQTWWVCFNYFIFRHSTYLPSALSTFNEVEKYERLLFKVSLFDGYSSSYGRTSYKVVLNGLRAHRATLMIPFRQLKLIWRNSPCIKTRFKACWKHVPYHYWLSIKVALTRKCRDWISYDSFRFKFCCVYTNQ